MCHLALYVFDISVLKTYVEDLFAFVPLFSQIIYPKRVGINLVFALAQLVSSRLGGREGRSCYVCGIGRSFV